MIKLIQGDCLEKMRDIESGSVDMCLTDLPYGTTACSWDNIIPFEPMWEQLKRIIKPNGAIVLHAAQPFTSKLISSNYKMFKYCWVWDKKLGGNPLNAKIMPLKTVEDIVVFGSGRISYNPIMRKGVMRMKGGSKKQPEHTGKFNTGYKVTNDQYYPTSIIEVSNAGNRKGRLHPTQKPVKLMEYLIKTYTNEGETVLDFTMGSGSTGCAAKALNRDFIGIELDQGYFDIASKRIAEYSN